uniref:hypothetical protein n=1 Tax=Acetatifactor sp. TaxID=1872090 RepID=UPI0040579858
MQKVFEKIIEQIEKIRTRWFKDSSVKCVGIECKSHDCVECIILQIQECIKQVAEESSNDVCEWHKVKNGNAYKCNTHAEIHDSRVLDWCICPYCGKKIKIISNSEIPNNSINDTWRQQTMNRFERVE